MPIRTLCSVHAQAIETISPALFTLLQFQFVFCYVFEIEFIEMSEMAVPAPDREVPRTDNNIVGTGDLTVPTRSILHDLPDRIFPDFCQETCLIHILHAGNEDTGSPAVVAGYLGLVGDGLDDLVCNFFAMIAVRAVFREDETITHGDSGFVRVH